MKKDSKKKSPWGLRIFIIFLASIPAVGIFGDLFEGGCGLSSLFGGGMPGVRSLEDHAKHGEAGGVVPAELQKRWVLGAQEVLRQIDLNRPNLKSITVDEALAILKKDNGIKELKALKKKGTKYVYFPKLDTHFDIAKFPIVAKMYAKGGKDLATETVVRFPIKGTDGEDVYLPSYFGEEIMAAARAANVKPDIAWGVRDVNLRSIMWARTLIRCQDDPKKYIGIFGTASQCDKKIKREVAKPDTPGFGHIWAADINNWQQFKNQLAEHGFVVGCSSILSDDLRHTSWTIDPQDSTFRRAGCQGSQFLKKFF